MVDPEDQDRFVMRVEEAVFACRIMNEYKELFGKQVNHLKDVLGNWTREHIGKIDKVFLTLQDARMLFLIVAKGSVFDPDLEKDLTDLDLKIARDPECSQINLDVQTLPLCGPDGFLSFCNPGWMCEYIMPDAERP